MIDEDPLVEWLTYVLYGLESKAKLSDNPRLDVVAAEWYDHHDGRSGEMVGFSQRAVLARVEAERKIIAEHHPYKVGAASRCGTCDAYERDQSWKEAEEQEDASREARELPPRYPCDTLRCLAYGHRFDSSNWRPEWAPDGVEVASQ